MESPNIISTTAGHFEPNIMYLIINFFFFKIGYGHIYPMTQLGKVVCILYSLLGVPINGILIGALGAYFRNKVPI